MVIRRSWVDADFSLKNPLKCKDGGVKGLKIHISLEPFPLTDVKVQCLLNQNTNDASSSINEPNKLKKFSNITSKIDR